MDIDISQLREYYKESHMKESEAAEDPIDQFNVWFNEAVESGLELPNAMALATVGRDSKPSVRMVLLKGFDKNGFVFFTNYQSRKGEELQHNPSAALVFWWGELERQIRIEGSVRKISGEESDRYFHTRPKGSQLGAWASPQSRIVENQQILQDSFERYKKRYDDRKIPRPPHWGGFCLRPHLVEFWQGRPDRLHDRLQYTLETDGRWKLRRLAP
jgi:pyridoxamine 5'-phosphate oxidase